MCLQSTTGPRDDRASGRPGSLQAERGGMPPTKGPRIWESQPSRSGSLFRGVNRARAFSVLKARFSQTVEPQTCIPS